MVVKPSALLDNLILNVGLLGNLRAATPLYQEWEGVFMVVFKRDVALPCTTWCDIEETISSLRNHLLNAHALESTINTTNQAWTRHLLHLRIHGKYRTYPAYIIICLLSDKLSKIMPFRCKSNILPYSRNIIKNENTLQL